MSPPKLGRKSPVFKTGDFRRRKPVGRKMTKIGDFKNCQFWPKSFTVGASRRRLTSPPKCAENRGFSEAAIFGPASPWPTKGPGPALPLSWSYKRAKSPILTIFGQTALPRRVSGLFGLKLSGFNLVIWRFSKSPN